MDNIANFFANFISGNQFINNLEVKELASLNKLEVKESLKVKAEAQVENLNVNKLKTRAFTVDDNEITFDPEAILKLRTSKIAFKVKDIFEVITFMKYIVKICGSKLEKCDFNTLLKNQNANQLMQLFAAFEKKQVKFIEKEKEKIKQEEIKKLEQEKENQNLKGNFPGNSKLKSDNNNLRKNISDKNDTPNFKQSKNY